MGATLTSDRLEWCFEELVVEVLSELDILLNLSALRKLSSWYSIEPYAWIHGCVLYHHARSLTLASLVASPGFCNASRSSLILADSIMS
jgi:hypothetical protein